MEKNEQNKERSTEKTKKSKKSLERTNAIRRKAIRTKEKVSASLPDVQKFPDQTKDYSQSINQPESAPKKGLQTAVKQAVNDSKQLAEAQQKQGAVAKKTQEKSH